MLKKTIEYKDFNDIPRTEDFYFNLTLAEVSELELSTKGGLVESLQALVASEDGGAIVAKFKEIILMAYGIKSDDGRRFIKNDLLREEFTQTNAYSALFMELATDAEKAAAFMNGIVPQQNSSGTPQDHQSKAVVPVVQPSSPVTSGMTPEDADAFAAWKANRNQS